MCKTFFCRNKKGINRAGQCQADVLKDFPVAYDFWKKWDNKHLHRLDYETYEELLDDIEVLKDEYNWDFTNKGDGFHWSREVELSKQKPKRRMVRESVDVDNDYVNNIVEDSGLNIYDDIQVTNGDNYRYYYYFGDCINTVDIDEMWDATQMAYVLYQSDLLKDNNILDKLRDGDREIPSKLLKRLKMFNINDYDHFVCGVNTYERIMFIYSIDDDIHYFFDAKL